MVSNSKDNHPSKATPIMNRVPNTHPKAVMQAAPHLSPMGREMSNSQWHIQVYRLRRCTNGFYLYVLFPL